mgnify:CR=1 FL=1
MNLINFNEEMVWFLFDVKKIALVPQPSQSRASLRFLQQVGSVKLVPPSRDSDSHSACFACCCDGRRNKMGSVQRAIRIELTCR